MRAFWVLGFGFWVLGFAKQPEPITKNRKPKTKNQKPRKPIRCVGVHRSAARQARDGQGDRWRHP
jgi:hypothetical protein